MLEEIKSAYIIKSVFDYFGKSKGLLLARSNKFLISKLEITPRDFKDAYENIEIYVRLSDFPEDYQEKENCIIGFRVEEPNTNDYEIYFNEKKIDIKKAFVSRNDGISNIFIRIGPNVDSLKNFFQNCKCIKEIVISNCVRRNIKDLSYMFYGCTSLKKLDITRLRTDNAIDMSYMFYGCSSLQVLDISHINTNNVTNMEGMFGECSSLDKLDTSNIVTVLCTNMSKMFVYCKSLQNLDLRYFNTKNAKFMDEMFSGCITLFNLYNLDFYTPNLLDISNIIEGCRCLNKEAIEKINAIKPKAKEEEKNKENSN